MTTSNDGMTAGFYHILKPIPELRALPGDFVRVNPNFKNPFILCRTLDRFDIEILLTGDGVCEPASVPPLPLGPYRPALRLEP